MCILHVFLFFSLQRILSDIFKTRVFNKHISLRPRLITVAKTNVTDAYMTWAPLSSTMCVSIVSREELACCSDVSSSSEPATMRGSGLLHDLDTTALGALQAAILMTRMTSIP